MPKRVLITGATGALGPRVVRTFHDEGFAVRTFSLDSPPAGMFPGAVVSIAGDITDARQVESAVKGIDYVVHMAALLHVDNPPPSLDPLYGRINIEGTSKIVTACVLEKVQRIIFFSSSTVYGPGKGEICSEATPPNPRSRYAESKLAAEGIVLAARAPDGRTLGTVLRLSAVYGPRVKGNYRRLVRALAHKRFIPVGGGKNRRTLVHDKDVASAAVLATKTAIAAGRIYNVTDGRIYTMAEIIAELSRLLGRHTPRIAIPFAVARLGIGALNFGGKLIGKSYSAAREILVKYMEDLPVSSERIVAELGFSPRYDLKRGWSEVIEELRQSGQL